MKPFAAALLLWTAPLWADAAADRSAIDATVRALNAAEAWPDFEALFTPDADREDAERLFHTHRAMVFAAQRPWSELSTPRIAVRSIVFITADLAVIQAVDGQFGSLGGRRVSLQFVMKRQAVGWRFVAVRLP